MSDINETVNIFASLITKDMAVPVAAMTSLVLWMKTSKATTWMQLESELRSVIACLKKCEPESLGGRTSLSLGSGCDLFMKYVTRAFSIEEMEFGSCKEELLRRGERFADMSLNSRAHIAEIGHSFIQDGCTVLIHGNSRVVAGLVFKAAETRQFNVIVTESRPSADGRTLAVQFAKAGIPCTLVLDAAVGSVMAQVDLCLVGAEGVMENGGIVNKLGTYQVAMVAKTLKKPFYVAVESYKFARMYPLTQRDVADLCTTSRTCDATGTNQQLEQQQNTNSPNYNHNINNSQDGEDGHGNSCENFVDLTKFSSLNIPSASSVVFSNLTIDFTPAEYITLLFTDLGVLTPAAVSDELIRLYQ